MQRLLLLLILVVALAACGDADADSSATSAAAPETVVPRPTATEAPDTSSADGSAASDDLDVLAGLVLSAEDLPPGWAEQPDDGELNELPAPDDPCFPAFALGAFSRGGGPALTPEFESAEGNDALNVGVFALSSETEAATVLGDLDTIEDWAPCFTGPVERNGGPGVEVVASPIELGGLEELTEQVDEAFVVSTVLAVMVDGSEFDVSVDQVFLRHGRFVSGVQAVGLGGPVEAVGGAVEVLAERLATAPES